MSTLLVGFDSAWTQFKSGAIVALLRESNGTWEDLGPPARVNYPEALAMVDQWQTCFRPNATVILLDQPTIVVNDVGQRPVENIVGSSVSRRYGGMQPANTRRAEMFGGEAPVWGFLARFGGPANPLGSLVGTQVIETYPVLCLIALRWTLPDARPQGRLPKYNPDNRRKFSLAEWQYVCTRLASEFHGRGIGDIVTWLNSSALAVAPRKSDQDGVDACICLLVALHLVENQECLLVGDQHTGYIVVPHDAALAIELKARCTITGRLPSQWVQTFRARIDGVPVM